MNAPDALASPPAWQKITDFILVGMFFGLATGAAEVAARFFGSVFLNRSFHYVGLNMVWTIPLADLILLGALSLIISLVNLRWDEEKLQRAGLVALVATAAYTIPLLYLSIHEIARILLALGVGFQVGGFLSRRNAGLRRAVRLVTLPAIVLLVVTALAFRAGDILAEHRALAKLPPPTTNSPNVLVVILDAVRAAELSLYGYARRTSPNLERLAEKSVVFDRAIPTTSWSLPSHASMLTGRYPHEMSADWDVPLDDRYPVLAELLRDRGYLAGGFIANYLYGVPEFGLSRGFVHYDARKWSLGAILQSSKLGADLIDRFNRATRSYYTPRRRSATEMNRRLLEWLPTRGSRPFFAFVNFFDAHEPYLAPAPYDRRFSPTEPPIRTSRQRRLSAAELRGLRDAYDGTIRYLDDQLASLLGEMSRRGDLSNTLVIITSDHGEEFGEHGWVSHGNGLYFPGLHVPLLISFPGRVPGGVRVEEGVTLRDLPATALDLLGFGQRTGIPGRSWAEYWAPSSDSSLVPPSPLLSELKRPRNQPEWYAVAKGDMLSIIVGRHHYIRNGDGREELFDIVGDPWEMNDISQSAESRAILQEARAALASALCDGPSSGGDATTSADHHAHR